MNAAQVTAWSELPHLTTKPCPAVPASDLDLVQIHVLVTSLHRTVRGISTDLIYASANGLPRTPGINGVGRTLPDGQPVYVPCLNITGSFVEHLSIPKSNAIPLSETADPVQVAGMVNPTMDSWMALKTRVDNLNLAAGFHCVGSRRDDTIGAECHRDLEDPARPKANRRRKE